MKEQKELGKRKVKTSKGDNERLIYDVSSSVVTFHYREREKTKAKRLTRLGSKHYDLRESHEVELRAWL